MSTPLLEAIGIAKNFGALAVIKDLTLRLDVGERHALIGPNGAGKTTLIGLLSGAIATDAGRITLLGRDITRERPERRVKHGLVRSFQINNLFPGLTVLENIFLAVSDHAGASGAMVVPAWRRRELLERAEKIADLVDLHQDLHRPAVELSYGRQRQIEIAIAISLEPKVLLLDEPAAEIPSGEFDRLLDTIERLPPDIAILLIEHDMQIVRRFAKKVTVMVAGTTLISGNPNEVMGSAEVRDVYLGQGIYGHFTH